MYVKLFSETETETAQLSKKGKLRFIFYLSRQPHLLSVSGKIDNPPRAGWDHAFTFRAAWATHLPHHVAGHQYQHFPDSKMISMLSYGKINNFNSSLLILCNCMIYFTLLSPFWPPLFPFLLLVRTDNWSSMIFVLVCCVFGRYYIVASPTDHQFGSGIVNCQFIIRSSSFRRFASLSLAKIVAFYLSPFKSICG